MKSFFILVSLLTPLLLLTSCSIEVTTGEPPSHPSPQAPIPPMEEVATDWSSPIEFLGKWSVPNQDYDVISFDSATSDDAPHPHNGLFHLENNGEQTYWGIWYIQNDILHLEAQDGSGFKQQFPQPEFTKGPAYNDDLITFPDGTRWEQTN